MSQTKTASSDEAATRVVALTALAAVLIAVAGLGYGHFAVPGFGIGDWLVRALGFVCGMAFLAGIAVRLTRRG